MKSVLQVLVSIQSMILSDQPYFNEPGFQSYAGTTTGQINSASYNKDIRLQNLRHALCPALTKPAPAFKDVLAAHFRHRKEFILKMLDNWKAKDASMAQLVQEIKKLLNNQSCD